MILGTRSCRVFTGTKQVKFDLKWGLEILMRVCTHLTPLDLESFQNVLSAEY